MRALELRKDLRDPAREVTPGEESQWDPIRTEHGQGYIPEERKASLARAGARLGRLIHGQSGPREGTFLGLYLARVQ